MKIKNTRELRLRADSHARNDHVKQGTYGEGSVNGKANFVGCAVGCLSTPHRQRDLLRWIKSKLSFAGDNWIMEHKEALGALREEFGITKRLAVVAEACFEGQEKHGAAINFVRDFAHACPEGADIQDRHVEAFLRREGLPKYICRTGGFRAIEERVKRVKRVLDADGFRDYRRESELEEAQIVAFTERFLDWLRSRAPQAAAV